MSISRTIIDRTLSSPLGEAGYKVIEILHDAGHEAYWVGGAVRDMALSDLPREIDIAVSAHPSEVARLFPRSDDTDADLGAVRVSVGGHTFDVTTFRTEDDLSDGRRPASVQFASLVNDACRRDATINAMYFQPISRDILDPCHGLLDIPERLVRFIGDPETRIRHDALRSLRMIRLRATIDGQYDPSTYRAIEHCSSRTSALSGMRVLEELEKLLSCDRPHVGLRDYEATGILHTLLPEIASTIGIAQPRQFHAEGDVWHHLLRCTQSFSADHAQDVRLAALLHDIGKPETFSRSDRIHFDGHASHSADKAVSLLRRLQMPSRRIEKIEWLIRHHMMMGSFASLSLERKAHWYYHPWFTELLQLFWIDAAGTEPQNFGLYEMIIADYDAFLNSHPRPAKPLLSGDEIMSILDMKPGRALGDIIARLMAEQVHGRITTRAGAAAFVETLRGTF